MSREFGDEFGGFFHEKINNCLNDLKHESDEDLHKQLIPFFETLYDVAYDISSVEAGDSGLDRSIFSLLENIPKMIKELRQVEEGLKSYEIVAREAVRAALKKERDK